MNFFRKHFELIKLKFGIHYYLLLVTWGLVVVYGIISIVIITYYFFQPDIIFSDTGLFSIPKNIHWYYIFLGAILFQIIFVFLAYQFMKYMRECSFWDSEKDIISIYLILVINLLTIPFHLSLGSSFFDYQKGSEIFAKDWFLGTFRRILNENEREKLTQETVKNFLEKIDVTKEIKDKLKIWASENTKVFLNKYEDGSSIATEYVSDQLKIQKEFLQREEVKKLEVFIDKTDKEQQGWFPWIYDQTIKGLNCFNPFVADSETCLIAWLSLIVVISIAVWAVASNTPPSNLGNNLGNIPSQVDPMTALKNEVVKMQTVLEKVLSSGNLDPQSEINMRLFSEMIVPQQKIKSILKEISNTSGFNLPDGMPPIPLPQEKKNEIIFEILLAFESNETSTANMAIEIFQNLVTNF